MNVDRDQDLLDVLAESLGPVPPAQPSWAEVSALHRVIDSEAALREKTRVRSPLWRARRRASVAAAAIVLVAGGSAAAAVTGGPLPRPVRVAARAVGLPVESPQLAEARTALANLTHALAASPRDLARVRVDAAAVRDKVAALNADDRSKVEMEAQFLLVEADAALAPPPAALGAVTAEDPPAATASSAPAPAVAAPQPADDHGGRDETASPSTTLGTVPHPDDHGGSPSSGPGPSSDGSTVTTIHTDNSGPGSGGGSDDGSSDGESSGSDGSGGGGHSGPG